jgi:hypothetical protein
MLDRPDAARLVVSRRSTASWCGAVYPRRVSWARGTVALLLLCGLLAGCGAYTKQDFIARADAICVSTVRATRLIAPPSFAHPGAQQLHALATYASKVLPLVQSEARQLRSLPRPTGGALSDRTDLTSFLSAFAGVAADYQSLETAAAKADAAGVARAEATLNASPVTSLATRYGLRSCGTAGATYNS